jgi:hypothetical protein
LIENISHQYLLEGIDAITYGHFMLPEFTCGQVMLPEYPPSVDLNAQNRLKCGHFMLPARPFYGYSYMGIVTKPISLPLWQTYASRWKNLQMAQHTKTISPAKNPELFIR